MSADEFGRLICTVGDDNSEAVVTAAELEPAVAGLTAALLSLESGGTGECYWPEGVGEHRWVFRRVDDQVRVAALWSTGTMTGWEHVFWGEAGYVEFLATARQEITRILAAANA